MPEKLTYDALAEMIDHAALKPDLTAAMLNAACETAHKFGVKSVCVRPCDVAFAKDILANSKVLVGTVIGFPTGSHHPKIKIAEASQAIEDGADELDMVINVGWLKSGHPELVEMEIAAVVKAAQGKCVKVILETCLLTDAEIVTACKVAVKAGAQFVKTSTGFGTAGATVEHVKLMHETVAGKAQVKASGGIATLEDARAMIEAGATRLGTSKSGIILTELEKIVDAEADQS